MKEFCSLIINSEVRRALMTCYDEGQFGVVSTSEEQDAGPIVQMSFVRRVLRNPVVTELVRGDDLQEFSSLSGSQYICCIPRLS